MNLFKGFYSLAVFDFKICSFSSFIIISNFCLASRSCLNRSWLRPSCPEGSTSLNQPDLTSFHCSAVLKKGLLQCCGLALWDKSSPSLFLTWEAGAENWPPKIMQQSSELKVPSFFGVLKQEHRSCVREREQCVGITYGQLGQTKAPRHSPSQSELL